MDKKGIIVFGIETEIDENAEEDRVILFIYEMISIIIILFNIIPK